MLALRVKMWTIVQDITISRYEDVFTSWNHGLEKEAVLCRVHEEARHDLVLLRTRICGAKQRMCLWQVLIQGVCVATNCELITTYNVLLVHRNHHRPHAGQLRIVLMLVEQVHDLRHCGVVLVVACELAQPAEFQRDRPWTRADHLALDSQASPCFCILEMNEIHGHAILRVEASIK